LGAATIAVMMTVQQTMAAMMTAEEMMVGMTVVGMTSITRVR